MNSQRGIEKYPYKVIKEYNKFEIRKYEASLFTSVKLSTGKYESGSSNGFSILAGYIFGGNDKNQKIAMTSPVAMSMEDSMEVMFLVPKEYKKKIYRLRINQKYNSKKSQKKQWLRLLSVVGQILKK